LTGEILNILVGIKDDIGTIKGTVGKIEGKVDSICSDNVRQEERMDQIDARHNRHEDRCRRIHEGLNSTPPAKPEPETGQPSEEDLNASTRNIFTAFLISTLSAMPKPVRYLMVVLFFTLFLAGYFAFGG